MEAIETPCREASAKDCLARRSTRISGDHHPLMLNVDGSQMLASRSSVSQPSFIPPFVKSAAEQQKFEDSRQSQRPAEATGMDFNKIVFYDEEDEKAKNDQIVNLSHEKNNWKEVEASASEKNWKEKILSAIPAVARGVAGWLDNYVHNLAQANVDYSEVEGQQAIPKAEEIATMDHITGFSSTVDEEQQNSLLPSTIADSIPTAYNKIDSGAFSFQSKRAEKKEAKRQQLQELILEEERKIDPSAPIQQQLYHQQIIYEEQKRKQELVAGDDSLQDGRRRYRMGSNRRMNKEEQRVKRQIVSKIMMDFANVAVNA